MVRRESDFRKNPFGIMTVDVLERDILARSTRIDRASPIFNNSKGTIMVTRTEWYARTNALWPATLPPLTAEEAVKAGKKLYRFVMGKAWLLPVKITSGNRYSYASGGVLSVNPDKGWHDLVHDLSH